MSAHAAQLASNVSASVGPRRRRGSQLSAGPSVRRPPRDVRLKSTRVTVGVISDTHGLLRPEATAALARSDLIIHCGDIGAPEVIARLNQIAPVVAIRGNIDKGAWAEEFPATRAVEIAGALLYVLHDLAQLDLDPVAAGFQAVLAGHSHHPKVERRNGVLFVNPGSAGPRRFTLPVSLAQVGITPRRVTAVVISLLVPGAGQNGSGQDPAPCA